MSVLKHLSEEQITNLKKVLKNKNITYLPTKINRNNYIFLNVPQNEDYFNNLEKGIPAYYYLLSVRLTRIQNFFSSQWLGLGNETYRRTGYFWADVRPNQNEIIGYLKRVFFDNYNYDMVFQSGFRCYFDAKELFPYVQFSERNEDLTGLPHHQKHYEYGITLPYPWDNESDDEPDDETDEEPINLGQTFYSDECCICTINKPNILFCNCGHIPTCTNCDNLRPITKCPVCRTESTIKRKIQ